MARLKVNAACFLRWKSCRSSQRVKGSRSLVFPVPLTLSIMSEQEREEARYGEIKFRQGACHGAQWLRDQVGRMAAEGASAEQLFARLGERVQVLLDWREGQVELPEGNPWEWREEVLLEFISRRKAEW
jgi:hypothetical protein